MADEIRQELGFDATQALSALEELKSAFSRFSNALEGAGNSVEAFNKAAEKMDKSLTKANALTRQVAQIYESIRTPQERYATQMEKLNALLSAGAVNQETFNRAAVKAQSTLDAATVDRGAIKARNQQMREAAQIYEATRTPQELYTAQLQKLDTLHKTGAISQETHTRAVAQAKNTLDNAAKSTTSYMLSWQTLARVLQTQVIIRSLNAIRDALEFAVESQLKFSKAVTEIKAIDTTRTFGEIAADIRQMSDAFNQPILKVAEAQYQVISDQFVTLADRTNILTAANSLAKATEDDLVGSAQLLTGALNAYGESSDNAALRAGQFFKTIELGRIRASELGQALGRVQSVAHELGVSIEELNAALVSLTIGGMKSNEAATQLRGMLNALLKPSEGMRQALNALNMESGEAAARAYGLRGAFEAVKSVTDGSSQALGKLVPNIRGAAGMFRVLAEGAQKYEEAMKAQQQIDRDFIAGKGLEAMQTDAARLTSEFNKLRNFFTAELGADLVKGLNTAIGILGGASGLVGILRTLTTSIPNVAFAVTGVTLALRIMGTEGVANFFKLNAATKDTVRGFGTLKGAILTLALAEVAWQLGTMIGNKIAEGAAAGGKQITDELNKELENNKRVAEAKLRIQQQADEQRMRSLRQTIAAASGEYMKDQRNFANMMKVEEATIKASFDRIMSLRHKLVSDLWNVAETARKSVETNNEAIAEIGAGIEDRMFRYDVSRKAGGNAQELFNQFSGRAQSLAFDAALKSSRAQTDEEKKAADAAWRRAEAHAQQAVSIAEQVNDEWTLKQALDMVNRLDQERVSALRAQNDMQKGLAEQAEARAKAEEKVNLELAGKREAIEQKMLQWTKDESGKLVQKTAEQSRKDLEGIEKDIQEFARQASDVGGEASKKIIEQSSALKKAYRETLGRLPVSIHELEVAPDAIRGMLDQIQAGVDKLKKRIKVIAEFETITGTKMEDVGQNELMKQGEAALKASTEATSQRTLAQNNLNSATDKYAEAMFAVRQEITGWESKSPYTGAVREYLSELMKAHEQTKITEDDLNRLKELGQRLATTLPSRPGVSGTAAEVLNNAKAALEAIVEQAKAQKLLESVSASTLSQEQTQNLRQQIDVVNQGTTAVEQLAQAWRDVAQAQAASGGAGGSGGGVSAGSAAEFEMLAWARGGRIPYFARGGRGTDTIPAMLSPGEFVVNSNATRRFYSQLVAINSGHTPIYRDRGGNVSNVTVGDININGASQPRETAREVVKSIKRELRRGTSKW